MIPYNLFILPVILGYIIASRSLYFKFNNQRLIPNIVLFESVFFAVITTVAGFVLRTIITILFPKVIPWLSSFLKQVPITPPKYLWTIVFTFVLFVFVLLASNWRCKKRGYSKVISKAIRKHGSALEQLLLQSLEEGVFLQITLKNEKVYVGFCETIIPPSKNTTYIKITPLISGYRDKDTKEVIYTTDYYSVVEKMIEEDSTSENLILNTDTVIKSDEIMIATIFDFEVNEKFKELKSN